MAQLAAAGTARASAVLPDLVAPDLDIVFCGTAAGAVSAAERAYYAGPGNAFWPTLFQAGLTPRVLKPDEYRELARWNMGLTDLAKHVSGADSDLAKTHFDVAGLRRLIATFRPRVVAFTGKRAAEEFAGKSSGYGLLATTIGATRLFVLPSPSGAARRHWNPDPWRKLAQLRSAMR